jgi:hypothetical protein
MAITTQDGQVAAAKIILPYYKNGGPAVAAGGYTSFWTGTGGVPAAGSLAIGNTTTGAIPTDATTGGIAFANPGGGAESYLWRLSGSASVTCTAIVYDRAWHAGSFTPTSGAIAGFTGSTVPNRPTDYGYELWVEINGVFSAAAHTLTITYVAQDGTGSRSATVVLPASAPVARMYQATLQGTDSGVRSISAISGSATPPTGSYNVLLLRRLTEIYFPSGTNTVTLDWAQVGFPRWYDDTCFMSVVLATGGTAPNPLNLNLYLVQG